MRAAPDTTFVCAHAGHGPATVVRGLLERNPNVMADLSARTPWIGPGTVLLRPSGQLDPAWPAALNDFPDRFVVGLDLFVPAHYRAAYVNPMVAYYRGLLGQLHAQVADMIGHANAERIGPLLEWLVGRKPALPHAGFRTYTPRPRAARDAGRHGVQLRDGRHRVRAFESALEQARRAAGEKDVRIGGGATVVNQYLAAGLVDELELHVVSMILGGGARLFEKLGDARPRLELLRAVAPARDHSPEVPPSQAGQLVHPVCGLWRLQVRGAHQRDG